MFYRIHEAARSGEREIVQLLVNHGNVADINAVTNFGSGWTPLALAMKHLDNEKETGSPRRRNAARSDPLVQYLLSLGGLYENGQEQRSSKVDESGTINIYHHQPIHNHVPPSTSPSNNARQPEL
jgi:Ankyrin repeats (many copies)